MRSAEENLGKRDFPPKPSSFKPSIPSGLCGSSYMELSVKVRVYLEDAERFLEEAVRELREAIASRDAIRARDAAEKAWNAVVQATNALLLYYTGRTPSSQWERRRMLRELEKARREFEELGFRDRYLARERNLHELAFYEGLAGFDEIEFEIEKARRYVEDVKRLVGLSESSGGCCG